MSTPQCLPPRERASRPSCLLPANTTDCHCHIYTDPSRYPMAQTRSYTPAEASLQAYLDLCSQLGISRTVQVSASVYGYDNRLTMDVIATLGQDKARGIAGVSPDISAAELGKLHDGGFRGVRLSTYLKGYGGTQAMEVLAPKLKPLGWHLQIHLTRIDELVELEPQILALPVPLVFDHLGGVRGDEDLSSPGFQALLRILAMRDDCWVKISSWYRRSSQGPDKEWSDMKPFVQALVKARSERLVFGTNWPHPNLFGTDHMPDDGVLVDRFCEWIPDEQIRNRIFADNPGKLYGFDDA